MFDIGFQLAHDLVGDFLRIVLVDQVDGGTKHDPAADIELAHVDQFGKMWRASFGGARDFGLGSALAMLLLIMIIPAMLFNIRNFRRGG